MTRSVLALGFAPLLAACTGAPSCSSKPVTAQGVGASCAATVDCKPELKLRCPTASDPSPVKFCTRDCDYADPASSECGAGASCVYVGAGGRCVPAACGATYTRPTPTSKDTTVGRINPEGVGQPCLSFRDCTGTLAKLCGRSDGPTGFDFCTADCDYSIMNNVEQCGAGADCAYVGGGRGRCVPHADAMRLGQPLPPVADVVLPCCAGAGANPEGVGKVCLTHQDCAANAGANVCPFALYPDRPELNLPKYCTHLCDFGDDASCGAGAFCWWRSSGEGGTVGSCAPIACLRANHPPPCP